MQPLYEGIEEIFNHAYSRYAINWTLIAKLKGIPDLFISMTQIICVTWL